MKHRRVHWVRGALRGLLTVVSVLLLGCAAEPTDEAFETCGRTITEWVKYDSEPVVSQELPPLDDLILYLDSSLSMQGYSDPSGAFEYSVALRAVRSVVDKLQPRHQILFRKVAQDVGQLSVNEATLFDASRSSVFYTGSESNLAGAIRSFDQPDPILNEGAGIARCHILVTDGVQHLGSATLDPECQAGSDPRCVNLAVRRLVDRNWGVHLFGIRSRFNSPIFSEIQQQ